MGSDYRPGDRSRREDDRYLLLEALLSARDQLYISWVGRSIRDNSERPASVLIGQLRDHLASGWRLTDANEDLLETHPGTPLQPFSARYFHEGDALFSYANEWQVLHHAAEQAVDIEILEAHVPEEPLVSANCRISCATLCGISSASA
jgi:exodeoxyribonuclease V gamma subunit